MQEDPAYEDRLDRARERKEPILFIVDEACQIVYESQENAIDQLLEFCPEPGRLRPDLCAAAKTLIIAAPEAPGSDARSAFVAPGHLMRLRRLFGAGKALFVLIIEPFRSRDTVLVAVRRYALTKREHQILILILEGANASEIAAALVISEHTVHGYFKRLLKKTRSRNRAAMVANVLEWAPGTEQRAAGAERPRAPAEGVKKS